MSLQNMTKDCNKLAPSTVTIIGDVMLDTFVYGNTNRISPEAPVPVVIVSKRINTLGGAGNVAANIVSIGGKAILIGRVGNDSAHKELSSIANKLGVNTDNLIVSNVPTISKTRIVSQGQQIVRIDEDVTDALDDDTRQKILSSLKAARKQTNVVIVSDYNKSVIDQQMFDDIKEIWTDGFIFVDPKVRKTIDYTGATLMTPNLKEAMELAETETTANTDKEAEDIATSLVEKFKMRGILCTRAGDGMTLLENNKFTHFKPLEKLEVRDVSGAGDTVISILAAGTAAGLSMEDAVELCNIAGGLVVAKRGTATISWPEIVDAMQHSDKYQPSTFK
ncbi:MAG: D-beta-D-heptose 7-phosphate kinase/D-beta-D-heptose 1-phosphate adenosyltransferase [Alphaproteobacteria bacterium]|jgi:D-beta-D-heptose 7-phosphate kinase/D-beta-D-heptose 1-phosphate adenosyltransferase